MNEKKILILGSTGMLGNALYKFLNNKYKLTLSVRKLSDQQLIKTAYGETRNNLFLEFNVEEIYQEFLEKKGFPSLYLKKFLEKCGEIDYCINAIGVTIPNSLANPGLTFFTNGFLPRLLSQVFGSKLIQITTDCVFNGKEDFPYNEKSTKTPTDIYGISKSFGEPWENSLVIRTSIIGLELKGFTGLLEWFLHQESKTIKGYTNHFWNGITTNEFAKICDKIISSPNLYPNKGLYHVFSEKVSKLEILNAFQEKFNTKFTITPDDTTKLNRCLDTIYDLNSKLQIPKFKDMIKEL